MCTLLALLGKPLLEPDAHTHPDCRRCADCARFQVSSDTKVSPVLRRLEVKRHLMCQIDITQLLEPQGPFDVIVHKLSDVMVEAERDSRSQQLLANFQVGLPRLSEG